MNSKIRCSTRPEDSKEKEREEDTEKASEEDTGTDTETDTEADPEESDDGDYAATTGRQLGSTGGLTANGSSYRKKY